MAKRVDQELKDYRGFVIERLSTMIPVLQKVAQGDFTARIEIPQKEDEFTVLLFALNLTIEKLQGTEEERKKAEEKAKKHSLELENIKQALLNVMDDLNREKIKLEEERAKSEAILLSIGEGLFVVDLEGKIILTNRAFEDLLGWKPEEVRGKSFVDLVPAEDDEGNLIPPNKRPIMTAIVTGKEIAKFSTGSDYYLIRKDKTKFPVAYKVTLVTLGGKIIGAIGVFRDITHEKEIDRAKTEFVSLASHQLKTPATGIKAYLAMLLDGDAGKLNPNQLEFASKAYTANERELKLVEDMLNVARIESGRLDIEKKTIDLSELVGDLVIQFSGAIKNRKQTIKFIKPREPIQALIDPEKLWMALSNLVDNASKYSYEGGKIEVSLEKDKKNILISVRDSGVGIAKSDVDKLFQKLSRIDNPLSAQVSGTGLGLFLTKRIIDLHGGEIKVTSVLGKGSVFMVQLPQLE